MPRDRRPIDFARLAAVVAYATFSAALASAVAGGAAAAEPPELVAPSEPLTAREQQARFRLPPGFEIELVAEEPNVQKPINLAFDHRGRLWCTNSVEYPFPAAEGAAHRDYVRILEDTSGDGAYDTFRTYAEGLNIPIGVLPITGGALVYSIPRIDFFPDADGDDRADQRTAYYGTFEFRDTHGMGSSLTRWIDGWIYGCHGFANTSRLAGSDGHVVEMNSGNTYRLRTDGSHIEQFTWGQVNPFGLAIDPLGNVFSSDCHTLPAYQLLRGAYYPSFGKPHDGLGFGPEMMQHLHGSTGIAGIVYYEADHFPAEYRGALFIGNPVTGRVNLDRLEPHGSTLLAIEQPDFVACDDPWFRPVDLQLGPDGALYIADFYNRIIGHYEVPLTHPGRDRERGRIWRVVYRGTADEPAAPLRPAADLTAASLAELIEYLGDANLTVRVQATNELVDRYLPPTGATAGATTGAASGATTSATTAARDSGAMAEAIAAVEEVVAAPQGDPVQRAHGLWVLERLGGLDAALVERLAADPDRLVRVHLVKMLAERNDWSSGSLEVASLVRGLLTDDDAFVRRAAADALGRHPAPENLGPLLELWAATPEADTHLVHVVRMALRDQLRQSGMYQAVASLLAADRSAGHTEQAERNAALVADVSLGHRAPESAAYVWEFLDEAQLSGPRLETLVHHALRFADEAVLSEMLRTCPRFSASEPIEQMHVLRGAYRALEERGAPFDRGLVDWSLDLTARLLGQNEAARVDEGIALARDLRLAGAFDSLAEVAGNGGEGDRRATALEACVVVDAPRAVSLAAGLLAATSEPLELRVRAASALAATNRPEARERLIEQLTVSPEPLALSIATALASHPTSVDLLLATIESGKASARLLLESSVEARLRVYQSSELDERIAALTAGLPPRDERLAALVAARRDGFARADSSAERGSRAFDKVCAACHRLAGRGAKIGPDLDGVGLRGVERLVEDVLDPSRNVDQAFRSTIVATNDGRVLSGLVLREEGRLLILADTTGKEIRLPLDEIDQREVSPLSPMPANVPDLLSEAEFYDLLAYLLAQRADAAAPAGR